ncbi:copper/zinc superoxide dismutase [Trichosporon asahii var. asahii CBS 8904]|uniref:Copper/zinc superoxide dismutase n=1 Tax=Trichosporon asahii var. asahii (strain CBS 8904) TaxID=1220162 RepID=K1V8Z6_TRIAC|nr:copper/zinc superoxide dismutase [Trichosporon asahii var. asahii CBS 8904]
MVAPAICAGGIAAISVLKGASNATGHVIFTESEKGVHVTGTITGLEPLSTHGFHVHEFGDISGEGCLATGGHYNPFNQTHGAPEDKVRHAGDLGNVVANENGTVILDITDRQLRLITEEEDGQGGDGIDGDEQLALLKLGHDVVSRDAWRLLVKVRHGAGLELKCGEDICATRTFPLYKSDESPRLSA